MGLTKQYLGYKHAGSFNIIAGGRSNINFISYNGIEGRYVVVGAVENAIIWDLKLGEKTLELKSSKDEVTAIRMSPDHIHLAVGYSNGKIEIFNVKTASSEFSISLHKSAISIIRFDEEGIRFLTGGLDMDIATCDMISESGKCRLTGHNGPITDGHFLDSFGYDDIIISSSKDTQIKFWNIETQTCFKTLIDNRTEVWGLQLLGNEFIVSSSSEKSLNVYKISNIIENETVVHENIDNFAMNDKDVTSPFDIIVYGSIQRIGRGRTINLISDKTRQILICHGTDDTIETFFICSDDDAKKRLQKRIKKTEENENIPKEITLSDKIRRLPQIKVKNKIKSIDIILGLNNEMRVIVSTNSNSLILFSLDIQKKGSESVLLKTLTQCGHQSEVRTVSFSSDNNSIASGSGESVKLWGQSSLQCLRTVLTESILSSCFVPGDKHILMGTKSGNLLLIDISISEIIETIPAHKSELWSICLLPNLKGCITCSSDTTVKLWNFEFIDNTNSDDNETIKSTNKILSLLHKGTLKLEESVLSIKISPNSKFLAAGLLDSTVKIFFLDSLKFYISLYGHKLPVLCMDISYDSNIIITGSADRNIKIWGLDFGDCHRSLFAHDDSVMDIKFIPKTHLFFSCGKDGKIKYWDADNFEKIMTLPGHIGEAYNMSISSNGRNLVTCGSDRVIRLFERSDEPIVLKDIQEDEREEAENEILVTGETNTIPTHPGLKLATRKTVSSEMAVESLIECLDICKNLDIDKNFDLHPLMKAYDVKNTDDFLIGVFKKIRSSDLEDALIFLPFSYALQILEKFSKISKNRKDEDEMLCKITIFLFKIHHKQISNNSNNLNIIKILLKSLESNITNLRDMIGTNYYGLQMLQRDIKDKSGIELFEDIFKLKKQKDKNRKKQFVAKRMHVQMM